MAQHDYDIANQSGAAFRTDLNNALDAIVTTNSGSTEPATTFAFQFWADTNANQLKMRNAANDGWIVILETDGEVPAKTFTGNITMNAQTDVRFGDSDSSNFISFQAPATVGSDVTFTLPDADGSADHVLKTNGSGVLSFAAETGGDISSTAPDRVFTNTTEEDTDGGRESKITFKGEQSGGEVSTLAQIEASHDGASDDEKGQIVFRTNDGSDGSSPTQRAAIDSFGRFLVGTSNSGISQQIESANTGGNNLGIIRYNQGTGGSEFVIAHSRSNTIGTTTALANGDTVGDILFRGAHDSGFSPAATISAAVDQAPRASTTDMPGRLVFKTTPLNSATPAERMRIHSGGVVSVANGIELGSGLDATAANTLDDYEEGTWTPTISGSVSAPTYTASVAVGNYTKVGGVVTISWLIIVTGSPSGGSGNWQITGAPFPSASQSSYMNVGTIGYNDALSSGVHKCYIDSVSNISLIPTGTTQANLTYAAVSITTGYLTGTITYVCS